MIDAGVEVEVELLERLLDDDEEFRFYGEERARIRSRHVLVEVSGDSVRGLPSNASDGLRDLVRAVAAGQLSSFAPDSLAPRSAATDLWSPVGCRLEFDDAFIIGGQAHLQAVRKALADAVEFVVIHSTFVNADKFRLLLDDFRSAYERGCGKR